MAPSAGSADEARGYHEAHLRLRWRDPLLLRLICRDDGLGHTTDGVSTEWVELLLTHAGADRLVAPSDAEACLSAIRSHLSAQKRTRDRVREACRLGARGPAPHARRRGARGLLEARGGAPAL